MGGFCLIRNAPEVGQRLVVEARRAIVASGAPEPVELNCAGGVLLYKRWRDASAPATQPPHTHTSLGI